MSEPDPWDECAACGHDRDDHDGPHGECEAGGTGCSCRRFEEASDG